MTNFERIKEMTAEELAEWIGDNVDCSECKHRFQLEYCGSNGKTCYETWEAWLNQEEYDED